MKTIVKLAIPLSLAVASYAENWNAKLLDASCYDKSSPTTQAGQTTDKKSREAMSKNCAPTASTTAFAIQTTGGKVYKLDPDGNTKAAAAMQGGTLKPDHDGDVHATVAGTLQGDSVKVDSVMARGHTK